MSDRETMSIGAEDVGTLVVGQKPAPKVGRTVYMVRHQVAGILSGHVFLAPPTDAQKAPIIAECVRVYGEKHPKTGDGYWSTVVETVLLDKETPAFPKREPSTSSKENVASAPKVGVSAAGTVVNPGEKA